MRTLSKQLIFQQKLNGTKGGKKIKENFPKLLITDTFLLINASKGDFSFNSRI